MARIRFFEPEPVPTGDIARVSIGDVWAVKRNESVKVAGREIEFLSLSADEGVSEVEDPGMETMKPWRVFS